MLSVSFCITNFNVFFSYLFLCIIQMHCNLRFNFVQSLVFFKYALSVLVYLHLYTSLYSICIVLCCFLHHYLFCFNLYNFYVVWSCFLYWFIKRLFVFQKIHLQINLVIVFHHFCC